jgi:monoamine oxidase
MTEYDMIIVGAGIAGLRTALEFKKLKPNSKILILEMYKQAGGRMETIHTTVNNKKIQYESGAGRINANHFKLIKLVKSYGLHLIPLSKELLWRKYGTNKSEPNTFEAFWFTLCQELNKLPTDIKRQKTLRDLAIDTLGVDLAKSLLEKYAYRAEIEVASAESSIDMYTSMSPQFYVLKEGFSALTEKMLQDVKKHKITIHYNHKAIRVEDNKVLTEKDTKYHTFLGKRVVLAVHRNALQGIYPFSPDHPLVKAVTMEPLLRIYSVYKDASWFPKHHLITNSPLRNIIPINQETGLIMSSYVDARDIELWTDLYKKDKAETLKEKVHNDTTALFPEAHIPQPPTYTQAQFWRDGVSYWNTNTDYKKLSEEALQAYPNIHVVGESFSTKQQWIEGSLEHADQLIALIKSQST